MEAAPASDARRFGKYTLVAKLATGGMAEIFLARLHGDGGFEKLVCIKRILPHLAKDPQFVAMFLDEARVAARISHPNVCQVFELGEWHNQYYIAMEYLEGVPLSVFRRKEYYAAPPDPRLVAGFGVQACEGLHHAHQLKRGDGEMLGVVHRDISPQNLFATTDGIVKVLDFGIAKVQDASIRTSTGVVKGTYAYMAPEQLRNEKLDRRVDVWAVGVVLWETLAQRQLFKRETEFLTFEAITKLPIPDVCEVRPDVPALLGDVIARALARDPDDRFPSARAFGEALAQAVAPLGGAASTAAVSDEVSHSFESALAEQRMLLRIAHEGGHFDLDKSSPLVGHGTHISSTPVSNIKKRVEEAQAEVAQYVAAQQAIESLDDDSAVQRRRFETDGAFTPAPSRRSSVQAAQRPSQAIAAQRHSKELTAANFDDTPPVPIAPPATTIPHAPARASRLPWIIALVAVLAAATTAIVLYLELREKAPKRAVMTTNEPIVMLKSPAATPATDDKVARITPGGPGADKEPPKVDQPAVGKVEQPTVAPPQRLPLQDKAVEPTKKVEAKKEPPKLQVKKEPPKVEVKKEPPKVEVRKEPPKVEVKKEPPKVEVRKEPPKVEVKKEPPKVEPKVEKKVVEPPIVPSGPPGSITIDSKPMYAIIYVDGRKLGETPVVNTKLAPGKHTVRAVSQAGATRTMSITIESGKTAPILRIEW